MRCEARGLLVAALSLMSGFVTMPAQASVEDEFYRGDISLYPAPSPISRVAPNSKMERDELAGGLRNFPGAVRGTANSMVRVRIVSLKVAKTSDRAITLMVSTVWENIHPKVKVNRDSLERKADRTMGVGGLFGGGARSGGQGGYVLRDMAYKVPKWGQHIVLLADGIAYPLDDTSKGFPDGADPEKGMVIARQHQTRSVQFAFRIPANAHNLALHLFDYANGHITIPFSGDASAARTAAAISNAKQSRQVAVGMAGSGSLETLAGKAAPEGWRFYEIRLAGRSLSRRGGQGDIARIPLKGVWLQDSDGFAYPAMMTGKKVLRFFPEFPTRAAVTFMIPQGAVPARTLLRAGNQTLALEIPGSGQPVLPKAVSSWRDGKVAEISLLGAAKLGNARVMDIAVRNLSPRKGVELLASRQFELVDGQGSLPPDMKATAALARGAREKVTLPPGAVMRFLLVFPGKQGNWRLHYRGFREEHTQPIGDQTASIVGNLLTRSRQATQERASLPKAGGQNKSGSGHATPATDHDAGTPSSPLPALPATPVAPIDLKGVNVVDEKEPNDKFEQAAPVDGDEERVVRGHLDAKQDRYDHFVLETNGKPQLWDVTASGVFDDIYYLGSYRRSRSAIGGWKTSRETRASIRNLYLLPGRHYFRVSSSGHQQGEYYLRFTPKGPPDPDAEREKNDGQDTAQAVRFGQFIHGSLTRGDDDYFRFSLDAPTRVRFTLQLATDAERVRAELNRSDRSERFGQFSVDTRKEKKTAYTREALLGEGDYDLVIAGDKGTYRFRLDRFPPSFEKGMDGGGLKVRFDEQPPTWSAFRDEGQSTKVEVSVDNRAASARKVELHTWISRHGWQAIPAKRVLELAAGEKATVPVSIAAPADIPGGDPLELWVIARDEAGHAAASKVSMPVVCGAPPLGARQVWRVPASMLGGVDVAWSALGASLVDPADERHMKKLIDGMTPDEDAGEIYVKNWNPPPEVTVDLAGDRAVPVTGFLLHPGGCRRDSVVDRFEVLLSENGRDYSKAIEGRLDTRPVEQAFALDRPVDARYARLRLLSSHGNRSHVCLGEWKVVAKPGLAPWQGQADIAELNKGGHLVRATPLFRWKQMLSSGKKKWEQSIRPGRQGSVDWVIGFHHDRAAKIAAMEWHGWSEQERGTDRSLGKVRVSVSLQSPLGPWHDLGEWTIGEGEVTRFDMKQPVWARFVRFAASGLQPRANYALPRRLRIFEAATTPKGYRSALGEWGHYGQKSFYEYSRNARRPEPSSTDRQGTKAVPLLLEAGKIRRGEVRFGKDEDWYQIEVGEDQNTVELDIDSDELFKLGAELIGPDGRAVAWTKQVVSGRQGVYQAEVRPGKYRLHIRELPKSVAMVWDQSGSVTPYIGFIYRALAKFSQSITPEAEYANFLPFQLGPHFLLEDWSDQPLRLLRTLNDYDRDAGSSAAETHLAAAVRALGERQGGRVIVLLTDAESGEEDDVNVNAKLWKAMENARPRIFSVELHRGSADKAMNQQDRMQDWAMANGGHYAFFRTQADLDTALNRAICKTRRPARYSVRARLKKVEPGSIRVERGHRSAAGAIELILDASGSMYKKLKSGKTRIAVAKEVMGDLVNHVIPPKTPVALRVYGHRTPRSCRTDLEVPLSPLNRERMTATIRRIDPKSRSKTPLAESIRRVARDLKKAKGKKLVLLVTDGKESCDGDPAAAIRDLKKQGVDVQVNIVGFAIKDKALKKAFADWAKLGGGSYFSAANQAELSAAVKDAISPKFEVLDDQGQVVAHGVAGGDPVPVKPGQYRVRILSEPAVTLDGVTVDPGKETRVSDKQMHSRNRRGGRRQ